MCKGTGGSTLGDVVQVGGDLGVEEEGAGDVRKLLPLITYHCTIELIRVEAKE